VEPRARYGAVSGGVCGACRKADADHVDAACDARQFVPMTPLTARERATKAAEHVRDLRRLLGQAMADEARAKELAREAERAAT